jgi:hypothetical protein
MFYSVDLLLHLLPVNHSSMRIINEYGRQRAWRSRGRYTIKREDSEGKLGRDYWQVDSPKAESSFSTA